MGGSDQLVLTVMLPLRGGDWEGAELLAQDRHVSYGNDLIEPDVMGTDSAGMRNEEKGSGRALEAACLEALA